MKNLVFAPETTRMIEIAKESKDKFHCVFFGYSDIYSHLIEQAGFEFRRMTPWLTKEKIEHLWKVDRMTNDWLKNTKLWIKPFQRVAKHYGIKPIKRLVDIYEDDFNLVTDIPELADVKDLPHNWQYVGPIFTHLEGEIPSELLNLSHKQPIIYCAMGSSANRDILKTVIESFDNTPYTVIAPVKTHIQNQNISVPKNVLVYDWLPAPKVNPLADIAVIHGGQGTVQTACAAGTPFVGIGLQPEQESNIDAIVRQGSAIRIRKRRLSRKTLIDSIEQFLNNPLARQKPKRFKNFSQIGMEQKILLNS